MKVAVQVSGEAGIVNDAAHGVGDHPVNVESAAGVAVSVTVAPAAYDPLPVVVPLPVPALVRVRGYSLSVKVTVQVSDAAGIVNDAAQGAGDHPANVEPAAGVAVSVTVAPAA